MHSGLGSHNKDMKLPLRDVILGLRQFWDSVCLTLKLSNDVFKLVVTRIGEQCYSRPTQACDTCDFLICAWFTRINDGDAFWYHICENTVDCVRLWETGINELNGALHNNYTAVICLTLQTQCPLGPATLGLQHILGLGMSAVGTLKWHFLISALQ